MNYKEAWEMLAKVIERESAFESAEQTVVRIRGAYFGILTRLEDGESGD